MLCGTKKSHSQALDHAAPILPIQRNARAADSRPRPARHHSRRCRSPLARSLPPATCGTGTPPQRIFRALQTWSTVQPLRHRLERPLRMLYRNQDSRPYPRPQLSGGSHPSATLATRFHCGLRACHKLYRIRDRCSVKEIATYGRWQTTGASVNAAMISALVTANA